MRISVSSLLLIAIYPTSSCVILKNRENNMSSSTLRPLLEANRLLLGTNGTRELTINCVITFLGVCIWEGELDAGGEPMQLQELARRLGFAPTTLSQHMRYLGDFYRSDRPEGGAGLVRMEDYTGDRRRKVFFLTPRGKAIARNLEYILTRD